MYGGYQGAYDAYGNQYAGAQQGQKQQQQAAAQPYYQGVNPYANYAAALQPPPPPPPPAEYSTYPAATTTTTATSYYATNQPQNAQNPDYSAHQGYTHQGYDAAVYNYAQHNAPKASNNPWAAQRGPGGGGHLGKHIRQGSGDSKEYYCDTCKISCAGGIAYKEHLVGKAHKRREESLKSGKTLTNLAKNKLSYRCDLCNITCTGEDTYQAHVRGGKHQKTANLHKKMGIYVPEDVPTIIAPGEDGPIETKAKPKWHQQAIPGTKKVIGINTVQFVGGTKLNSTGQIEQKKREVALAVSSAGKLAPPTSGNSNSTDSSSNPLINPDASLQIEVENERVRELMEKEKVLGVGEEYVIDERDSTGKLIRFYCKICECGFTDPNAKMVHSKGRRHRLAYKNKVDSSLPVSPKPSAKKNKKKTPTSSSSGAGGGGGPPSHAPEFTSAPRIQWFQRVDSMGAQNSIIVDERTVEKKYELLNPGAEYHQNTEMFLKQVEYLFAQIAAKMGPGEVPDESEDVKKLDSGAPGAPEMLLHSLRRSGVYAKNTYLKEDEYAEMWLQTSLAPEPELLKRIVDEFGEMAKETKTDVTIETDPSSPIGLIVKSQHISAPYLRIMCTSPQFQDKEKLESSTFAHKEACADVYKQNRRRDWYTNHGEYLNSCKQVIRLLRDARSRHPVWTFLDDYQLELIVHNVISSTSLTLNYLEAFKRVLEAIASGYLFNAFLMDPCETTRINVLDSLSEQQKHELTMSAQNFVRQIAFNQIHEVLGIDRLDEFSTAEESRKRPFEPQVFGEYSEGVENSEDVENYEEEYHGENGEEEEENPEDEEPEVKRGRMEEGAEPKGAEPEMGAEPMDGTF